MVGLIDIVPLVERVTIRGHEIEVRGLDLTQLGLLVWEYPELRRLWETQRLDVGALLELGKPVIARLITMACAEQIDEERAHNLAPGEQAEILARILKVTLPTGVGPFVDIMATLGGTAVAQGALVSVTNSGMPPPSSEPTASTMQ